MQFSSWPVATVMLMCRPTVPLFRREIVIGKKVESAHLYASGLGHYTLSIDGQAPDDRFLAPGWTLYSKTCFYNGYDVTAKLKRGKHAIGVTVGNGFFNVIRHLSFVIRHFSPIGLPRFIGNSRSFEVCKLVKKEA